VLNAVLTSTNEHALFDMQHHTQLSASLSVSLLLISTLQGLSAGLDRDAADARSLGMAGSTNATSSSAFSGIISNPASIAWLNRLVAGISLNSGIVHGKFTDRNGNASTLSEGGFAPDGVIAIPLGGKLTLALGASVNSGLQADWRYRDVPGGADGGTTYGSRAHRSEISVMRGTAALGWEVTPRLSLGASVSAVWNRNNLVAPYIFQTQATLRSVKTLLDLETEGWGVLGQVGLQWRPTDSVRIGLAYRTESRVETHGHASGNADVQLQRLGLGAAQSEFDYDAEVTNVFPQSVTLGAEWQVTPRFTIAGAMEWLDWSRTFDTLVVDLENGNNADLNGLVKGDRLHDEVPLNWRDQWVVRVGAEYAISDQWAIRAGYSWARNPVPNETLTPLTAVIPEHTVSAGLGWKTDDWTVDFGWQWQLPREESVDHTILVGGEYAGSTTRVGIHVISLTTTYTW
jgi:long-chain fatty acid transport protein